MSSIVDINIYIVDVITNIMYCLITNLCNQSSRHSTCNGLDNFMAQAVKLSLSDGCHVKTSSWNMMIDVDRFIALGMSDNLFYVAAVSETRLTAV